LVEEKAKDLFEKVKDELPRGSKISDIRFEGCEIVLYTKNPDFFTDPGTILKDLVMTLKKRIILRPDPSICLDMEIAEKKIKKIAPKEAGVVAVNFEPSFGAVVIEAEKPGLVIGKKGDTLKQIKKETLWLPTIKRAPAIPTDIVKILRALIHKESDFRKGFLNDIGKKIHSGWRKTDWIRFTAMGGFREVGRSAMLIQTPESRILLDCGIKPGSNELPFFNVPEFDIHSLNGIVLSHAHLDHCGLIPALYEMGYDGPLYCTTPTRDLMVLLAMDFVKIMNSEGKQMLYTTKGIKEAVKHCVCLNYGEVSDITPDIRLTLMNSGHVLGSSLCHLHVGEGMHNILYTGDIKFDRTALYEPASTNFARAETVIIESTYGSSKDVQPKRADTEKQLVDFVKKTMKRKGKCLIPSFAVERSQDLMVILERAGFEDTIYLDGMVWDATAITTTYPEFLNRDMQKLILQQGHNPFTQKIFKRIGSQDERKKVLESKDPAVIIATSGMLVGGPSVWWLRHLAEDKKNSLVFVGYQGEGTMGRRIQKGWKEVPMGENGKNKSVPINLEIETVEGLSGHSDQKQLINYLSRLKQAPERVIIGHGEPSKSIDLARTLHKILRCETIAPRNLDAIRLK